MIGCVVEIAEGHCRHRDSRGALGAVGGVITAPDVAGDEGCSQFGLGRHRAESSNQWNGHRYDDISYVYITFWMVDTPLGKQNKKNTQPERSRKTIFSIFKDESAQLFCPADSIVWIVVCEQRSSLFFSIFFGFFPRIFESVQPYPD